MHLENLIAKRHVVAAGVYLTITQKCPLSCSHCSTQSTMTSPGDIDESLIYQFVSSFSEGAAPEFLLLTGGEPLLRPDLVKALSKEALRNQVATQVISGMYFASMRSDRIYDALKDVSHVTASIDEYHEREIPRAAVFRALDRIRAMGIDVSIQVCTPDFDGLYLKSIIADVRAHFNDTVPMLVVGLNAVGRGGELTPIANAIPRLRRLMSPCAMATWPVIASNGAIFGCCSQSVVDSDNAGHLHLGNIATTTWPQVQSRIKELSHLKVIRTYGPLKLAELLGVPLCDGYCSTCISLSNAIGSQVAIIDSQVEGAAFKIMESMMAESLQLGEIGVVPQHQYLMHLGSKSGVASHP